MVSNDQNSRLHCCRSMVVALLDLDHCMRCCGPPWAFWQFPMERLIGTLSPQIRSRSASYPALIEAVRSFYQVELLASHGERVARAH